MELSAAFIETIKHDKSKIVNDFIKEDLKTLFAGIGVSALSLTKLLHSTAKKLKKRLIKKVQKIREDGLKDTLEDMLDEVRMRTSRDNTKAQLKETYLSIKRFLFDLGITVREVPKRCKEAFRRFFKKIKRDLEEKKTAEERTVYTLKVLSYFTSFLVGIYLGREIPDKDIKYLGIGKHRNVFFHSIVPTIIIRLLAKFMFRVIDAVYAKMGDNDGGKDALALIRNNLGVMAGGLSVGIALHLLQDGLLEPSGVVRGPGFNTIISGTTLDDQAFLVVNAFFSFLLGKTFMHDLAARKAA